MTDDDRELVTDDPWSAAERAMRVLGIAIAMAGIFIALAIYWRPPPPRYQMVSMGDQVVRLNTKTGSMIACNVDTCGWVIRESHGLDENSGHALLPPRPAPKPALPSPSPSAAGPAPATAPAAPPAPAPKGR